MGKGKAKIFAFMLAAGLAAGAPARAENASPAHAPCTSLDLWSDLKAVIDGCEALIKSDRLEGEDLAEALRHQGDAYFRSFLVRFAFNNYQRALQLKPDWPRALWNLGNAASALGYGDLAMQSQRRAIEVDPTYSKPHAALANLLWGAGDNEGALKELDRALELDPKDYLARYNRALKYSRLGRHLDALHDLDALLADDEAAVNRTYVFDRRLPDEDFIGDLLRSRAIVFRDIGSWDEALASLQRALDRKPGYANAAIFRSQMIRSYQGYEPLLGEALTAVELAAKLHPDSPEIPALAMERAQVLSAMGREQEVRALLADSARFEPSAKATFFMERSYAWERLKEYDHAEADLRRAMSMDAWHYQESIRQMLDAGYLMSWPGPDPEIAIANAITACVHDTLC